jgi:hypothetical protein
MSAAEKSVDAATAAVDTMNMLLSMSLVYLRPARIGTRRSELG